MARLRTFIAIDPGKQIRDWLVALQETLTRTGCEVKWVEPENLHVTLLFLGEVDMWRRARRLQGSRHGHGQPQCISAKCGNGRLLPKCAPAASGLGRRSRGTTNRL